MPLILQKDIYCVCILHNNHSTFNYFQTTTTQHYLLYTKNESQLSLKNNISYSYQNTEGKQTELREFKSKEETLKLSIVVYRIRCSKN